MIHFEDKMERGAFQIPTAESAKPWGQRLHEVEFTNYFAEIQAGNLPQVALNSMAQQIMNRSAPEQFAGLSSIEKKLVLVHLAFFVKAGHGAIKTDAQKAIQPHLHLLNLSRLEDIYPVTVEDLLERINDL